MKRYFLRNFIAIFFIMLAVGLFSGTAFAADSVSATSANWSGYMAQNGTYTGVSGTFVMPELTYSSTLASNATWVGIGGKPGTNDLIQAGVYEIANSDGATYQAWYELLPADSTPIDLAVHPDDSISISITETSTNTWNIVITNNTTGKQFQKTVSYQSSYSSAEWIQERPLVDGTFANLSGYTPVKFTNATAIQNGTRVTLAQTNAQQVNLMDNPTNTALSVPSPIASNGTDFTVYRTSATVSQTQVATPTTITIPFSTIPPFQLHRTGRIIIPFGTPFPIPGTLYIIHF
ncbi:MAG TPA: G1 family glutamic endopeptidase [Candidatus Paceibacterota bacterium]|jgi:hypothetical protein|nr:G1 family glutamic endopeptidase [Candidatus Paceibacterota bacterium]